jgi:hypothetical protein
MSRKIKNEQMAQINILIAVNGEAIVEAMSGSDPKLKAGTLEKPANLGGNDSSDVYISMVTQNRNLTNKSITTTNKWEGEGGSELNITCNFGDELQWSIISFDMNREQTPYLYNGYFECQNPEHTPLGISPLKYLTTQVDNYFPPSDLPTGTPVKVINTVAKVISNVTTHDQQKLRYELSFVLVNNSNGDIIGYFMWDPFIVINSPK